MAYPFKKILCPIDFDDNSIAALDTAAEMARQLDATVEVLHVVPIVSSTWRLASSGRCLRGGGRILEGETREARQSSSGRCEVRIEDRRCSAVYGNSPCGEKPRRRCHRDEHPRTPWPVAFVHGQRGGARGARSALSCSDGSRPFDRGDDRFRTRLTASL